MLRYAILLMILPLVATAGDVAMIPATIAPLTDDDRKRISVQVVPGLRSSRGLSAELVRARAAMHEGAPVEDRHLRRLAGAGDGLAAQRYVRRLERDENATPSDIAFFAAVAVATGRVWTLETMIDAMHRLDPETEPRARIRKYIRTLYPHAWQGNTLALQAVIDFNGEGRLFGPLSDKTRNNIVKHSRAQSDGRYQLNQAVALLEQIQADRKQDTAELDTARLDTARGLLLEALQSSNLAVRTTAENLLRMIEERYVEAS